MCLINMMLLLSFQAVVTFEFSPSSFVGVFFWMLRKLQRRILSIELSSSPPRSKQRPHRPGAEPLSHRKSRETLCLYLGVNSTYKYTNTSKSGHSHDVNTVSSLYYSKYHTHRTETDRFVFLSLFLHQDSEPGVYINRSKINNKYIQMTHYELLNRRRNRSRLKGRLADTQLSSQRIKNNKQTKFSQFPQAVRPQTHPHRTQKSICDILWSLAAILNAIQRTTQNAH